MERLLAHLSEVADRRRWLIVGVWAALLVLALPFAGQVTGKLSNGGFEVPGSQSLNEVHYVDAHGAGAQGFPVLVAAPTPAQAQARIDQVVRAMRGFPQLNLAAYPCAPRSGTTRRVNGVVTCGSRDGTVLVVTSYAAVNQNEALKLAHDLRKVVEQPTGSVRTFVTGPGATYDTFQVVTTNAITKAEFIGIPIVLIVLIALFGALVASLLPLVMGVVSVLITFAVMYFIASSTEVSIYAEQMASMVGLGVAVDYSLFILARFREELAAGTSRQQAVATAMRTSGTAVVFSGMTVIVSLGTIWLVPVRAVQSMAGATMIVVFVAVIAAATLLPSMLHLLGPNVNRGRVRVPFRRPRPAAAPGHGFWHVWTYGVMRRPLRSFTLAAGALIVLALPALALTTANTSIDQLPRNQPIVQGHHLLTSRVTGPGEGRDGSLVVLAIPHDGTTPAALRSGVASLAAQVARLPHVTGTSIQPLGQAVEIVAAINVDPESATATNQLVPAARRLTGASPLASAATLWVSGVSAFNRDLNDEVGGDLAMVIVAVLLLAYVLLLLLLRSVVLPLKAVVMNLLSIGAAYGVCVAVFQWGWMDWTGFHHLGTLGTLTPPLVLVITFGLSMDYEVFLLSRIKERYEVHRDNARAVAEGLEASARIITSAAVIMVVVFGAFILTGVPAIKEIGVGLAVAIAIDATITRLVLVPATMRLLGDWNWWLPGWLDRLIPHLAHEEPAPARRPASETA
jgi:RND superfamily putative drug exporter